MLWLLGHCSAKVITEDNHTIYPFSIESGAMTNSSGKRAAYVMNKNKKNLL